MLVLLVQQDMREELQDMINTYRVEKFLGELYEENSYLCIHTETNDAIIIDPATEQIASYVQKHNIKVQAILVTHAHADHILAVDYYVEKYGVPVYAHQTEARKFADPELNLSVRYDGVGISIYAKAIELKGVHSTITLPSFTIEYFLLPGHSQGNLMYHIPQTKMYFVGDSVFSDSIGRYDLPGSDLKAHVHALKKFETLPQDSKIYSGHGPIFRVKDLAKNDIYQRFVRVDF